MGVVLLPPAALRILQAPGAAKPAKTERTFDVALGYSRVGGRSRSYYKIAFQGSPLVERGTLVSPAEPGANPFKASLSDVGAYDLRLVLDDGAGRLDGPLADLVALRPFSAGGEFFRIFKGKVQASSKLFGDRQLNVGAGLESVNVAGFLSRALPPLEGTTKILRLGVLGEKQTRERGAAGAGSQTEDTLQFTYRGYAGQGFGFRVSRERERARLEQRRRIEDLTQEEARALGTGPLADDPLLVIGGLLGANRTPELSAAEARRAFFAQPLEAVRAQLRDQVDAYLLQEDSPSFNVEAKFEGSYNAAGGVVVRRYNALYSFGANVWFDPRNPGAGRLSVVYQNGTTRGAPRDDLTGIVVSLGFRF